ncbi:kanamycin kinase [Pseudonocardia oroxyli]|uniref:Kanamycin kinase n=1 Tax=Pseudonocardia oroxyli TaxID=366584 RepID=A0A1G8EFL0_PSEOR|nr:kanamycin kinase [Pseudonocardia oroxyli]
MDVPPGLAGPPGDEVQVPAVVTWLAAGAALRPVWHNMLGGLTYEIPGRCYVKWAPPGVDLAPEAERLAWAAPFVTVPTLLEHGADSDGSWLVTAPLPGRNAVENRWLAEPERAVEAVGAGLRALHDALPVAECPFSWDVATRRARIQNPDPHRFGLTLDEALRILDDPPEADRLVVCHGDACVPNTLLDDDGRCCGHVDLGSLGVADRWADLAAATWSTIWNYGPGHEHRLLDAYGVAPDPERQFFYRLLWDLT